VLGRFFRLRCRLGKWRKPWSRDGLKARPASRSGRGVSRSVAAGPAYVLVRRPVRFEFQFVTKGSAKSAVLAW
jgi:hypothetical protein